MTYVQSFGILLFFVLFTKLVAAQGCSDAGFCTIGNFNQTDPVSGEHRMHKHAIDMLFIYGAHGKNERFYQPQLNYRLVKKDGAFYELRLPFTIAKNIATGFVNRGIGDAIITYNSNFALAKRKIDYSLGIRASFTNAGKSDRKGVASYPMYLQSGLGTTDLVAVVNYDAGKYLSLGTGVQLPVVQYNENVMVFSTAGGMITGMQYRRMPDALLKLTGHYASGKFKFSGGLLSIFHVENDHYNTAQGKYILEGSKGTTINVNAELNFALTKNLAFGFLYAEPLVTRKNIPDGLARSRIYAPKVTYMF